MSQKLDQEDLNTAQTTSTTKFIEGIMNLECVGPSTFFLIAIEANCNQVQASQIAGVCMDTMNGRSFHILKDIAKNPKVHGVWKTQSNTELMIQRCAAFLSSDTMRFSRDIVTISDECSNNEKALKHELYVQFSGYKRIPCNGRNAIVDIFKTKPTGKRNGKDDLLICLMWSIYYMTHYTEQKDKYLRK